jgi:hypothetical protein
MTQTWKTVSHGIHLLGGRTTITGFDSEAEATTWASTNVPGDWEYARIVKIVDPERNESARRAWLQRQRQKGRK